MTVSANSQKITYVGDGSSLYFTIPFTYYQTSDIEVWFRNEAVSPITEVKQTTGYSIVGSTLSFSVAPASGLKILVRRILTLTQGMHLLDNAPFPASDNETALDRVTLIAQQFDEAHHRALRFKTTSPTLDKYLPEPVTGDYLAWDASGNLQNKAPSDVATDTGAALKANNLSDLGSAASARTNLGLGSSATHASTDFEPANANIQTHIARVDNPHATTASQVGAEPANANIQAHISSTANPHAVTAAQVGASTAQWNASQIQGKTVDNTAIANTRILSYNSVSGNIEWVSQASLPTGTANTVPIYNGTGVLADSTVSTTELGYLSGTTSSVQTQLTTNANNTATNTSNISGNSTDISTLQTQMATKLASTLTSGELFVGNASNQATAAVMSGEASITNTGAVSLSNSAVIGKQLTGFVSGAGTLSASDTLLTAAQKLNGNVAANTANISTNTSNISTLTATVGTPVSTNTPSAIVKRDGSGNFSAGTITANLTGNVSGTASGVTGTVALTNGGTGQTSKAAAFDALSPNTTKGDLTVRTSSTNVRLPIGTDGQVPVADSTQSGGLGWKTLQQGAKNYITYNNFENNSTLGWSLAHTALSGTTPTSTTTAGTALDSTHGATAAAGTLSFTTVSSGQLAGTYSGSLASSAATTAGDTLLSSPCTIDIEDQAKMLAFKFAYKLSVDPGAANRNFSGSSSNTWAVWIYNVTSGSWIQPQGVYNLTQSSGVGIASGTFQTPSDMTQFQLALVNINATSGAVTLLLDDFSVGPQSLVYGPAMTDWQSYTITIGASTTAPTKGTVSRDTAVWRRVGDSVEILYNYKQTVAGTAGTGTYQFSLPAGLSVDTNKISLGNADGTMQNIGSASLTVNSGIYGAWVWAQTATAFGITMFSDVLAPSAVGSGAGGLSNGTVEYSVSLRVPISGWSSNSQMSSDTDTRVCAMWASPAQPTGTLTNSFNTITWGTTPATDTHAGYSAGVYTIQVSGWYDLYAQTGASAASATGVFDIIIIKNNSSTGANVLGYGRGLLTSASATNILAQSEVKAVWLNAGDNVRVQVSTQFTSATFWNQNGAHQFSVVKVTGPSVIAASESVNCRYTVAAAVASSTTQPINYSVKDYDSHSAVTVGVGWKFTAPVSGTYRGTFNGTSATSATAVWVYKNGAQFCKLGDISSISNLFNSSFSLKLLAGDYIDIRFNTSQNTDSAGNSNWISIERTGN